MEQFRRAPNIHSLAYIFLRAGIGTVILRVMNKVELIAYLEKLDLALRTPVTLHIYGSAACILLDEPDRTSLDVDIAGPYSVGDQGELRRVAESIGFPVNPGDDYDGDHLEWIGPLRLCLQPPAEGQGLTLWQGVKLRIQTSTIAELIASKLIRYDEIDQSDIRYLLVQGRVAFSEIEAAVARLPEPFAVDALVRENLANLKTDMAAWGAE
jgi:hypothetical protein